MCTADAYLTRSSAWRAAAAGSLAVTAPAAAAAAAASASAAAVVRTLLACKTQHCAARLVNALVRDATCSDFMPTTGH
jgi:hypothetical protein